MFPFADILPQLAAQNHPLEGVVRSYMATRLRVRMKWYAATTEALWWSRAQTRAARLERFKRRCEEADAAVLHLKRRQDEMLQFLRDCTKQATYPVPGDPEFAPLMRKIDTIEGLLNEIYAKAMHAKEIYRIRFLEYDRERFFQLWFRADMDEGDRFRLNMAGLTKRSTAKDMCYPRMARVICQACAEDAELWQAMETMLKPDDPQRFAHTELGRHLAKAMKAKARERQQEAQRKQRIRGRWGSMTQRVLKLERAYDESTRRNEEAAAAQRRVREQAAATARPERELTTPGVSHRPPAAVWVADEASHDAGERAKRETAKAASRAAAATAAEAKRARAEREEAAQRERLRMLAIGDAILSEEHR